MKVEDFDTETSTGCRYYDNVEIRDGVNSSSAASIATLCGKLRPKQTFKSTGRYMLITFKSDSSINGRGFKLKYTSGRENLHVR